MTKTETRSEGRIAVHHLKCVPSVFKEKRINNKPWEFRKNDRDFENGDMIIEREWSKESGYTGEEIWETISLIVDGGQFGIPEGYVVMTTNNHGHCIDSELSNRNPQSY